MFPAVFFLCSIDFNTPKNPMSTTESQARKAFSEASTKLQSALSEYTAARTQLAKITGELHAIDSKVSLTFKANNGTVQGANITLTDC